MRFSHVPSRSGIAHLIAALALVGPAAAGLHAQAGAAGAAGAAVVPNTYPTDTDPRSKLKPGRLDAGVAAKGMRLVSFSRKPAQFDTASGLTFANSDIAFRGNYVYAGNFSGFAIWDVSNPVKPVNVSTYFCPTSQGDPSIYGNLLFVSAEGGGNRNDCKRQTITDPKDHMAGVRIFDVSDPKNPKLVKNVQNCKGSHTHTIIPSPTDKNIVYIYISGGGGARPASEMGDACFANNDPSDTANVMYRLDIIKVPLNNPQAAAVIGGARIFTDIGARPQRAGGAGGAGGGRRGGAGAGDSAAGGRGAAGARGAGGGGAAAGAAPQAPRPPGPGNCHDVTSYPAMNLLAGACSSHGLLVDISNPEKPVRVDYKGDGNFSLWHTAVFSNDGSKVVFTDEWGGGQQAMCQIGSAMELGGNTILSISPDKKLTQHAYFKIPASQTAQENCVSHNGGLVPVPGRDLMVQGWYQGGIDVFDFTDPDHPVEIAYYDRGPIPEPPADTAAINRAAATRRADSVAAAAGDTAAATRMARGGGRGGRGGGGGGGGGGRGGAGAGGGGRIVTGGSWGAYWYNGYIYSNEIDRGFDIYELQPSAMLSANELAAAKLVKYEQYNPQSQPKIVWPAAFPVVRSYLDQLVRGKGLAAARTTAITTQLTAAEKLTGAARGTALTTLATALDKDAATATDAKRVKAMAAAVRDLAAVSK